MKTNSSEKLKIAFISKSDSAGGGASKVAVDLCKTFIAHGHECHHYSVYGQMKDDFSRHLYGPDWSIKIVRKLYGYMKHKAYPEIIPWELVPLYAFAKIDEYDIIHFHDIASSVSPFTLQYVSRRNNVVWTFHDCSPFTAGCLYPMDCKNYLSECHDCPQLGKWPLNIDWDNTRTLHRIKKMVDPLHRIKLVAPSKWMKQKISESEMWTQSVEVIYNGVDTNVYYPQAKAEMRRKHGLPENAFTIIIAAHTLDDKRKGTQYALDVVNQIKMENLHVLLIGNTSQEIESQLTTVPHTCTGFVDDEIRMAEYLSSGDVMLFTSLADNFPLGVLESMACGTPIIGFATGGIAEVVRHSENGFLSETRSENELLTEMRNSLHSGRILHWQAVSPKIIQTEFSAARMYLQHVEFYQRCSSALSAQKR